jgi:hypothetical protein
LIEASTPLRRLAEVDAAREAVQTFVADASIPIEQLRFQPLRGRNPEMDATIVYAVGTTEPVGVIDVDPWPGLD